MWMLGCVDEEGQGERTVWQKRSWRSLRVMLRQILNTEAETDGKRQRIARHHVD